MGFVAASRSRIRDQEVGITNIKIEVQVASSASIGLRGQSSRIFDRPAFLGINDTDLYPGEKYAERNEQAGKEYLTKNFGVPGVRETPVRRRIYFIHL